MVPRSILALVIAAWSIGCIADTALHSQQRRAASMHLPAFSDEQTDGIGVMRYATIAARGDVAREEAVGLDLVAAAGDDELRVGAAWSEDEQRLDLGMNGGSWAFNVFTGSGEAYSRLDPDPLQSDPYLFHGGSRERFEYRGAAAELAIRRAVRLRFALAEVRADDLDERRTVYAGLTAGAAAAGVFSVARADEPTAAGVMLSWSGQSIDWRLRQVDHESGARFRSLGIFRGTDRGHRVGLSLRSGRNPLYREGDETRIMFHVAGTLGAPPPGALAAAEAVENGDGTVAASSGARGLALLGAGLVAVSIAGSSGSESKDEAVRIRDRNNAARTVLNQINPVSVRQNREYGGWIYRNADGTFGYTDPVAGTVSSVDIGSKRSVPGGTSASASYHTHGGPDPRYKNEEFSPADLLSDRIEEVDGYLGTPAGYMKLHEYRTGRITVIGRINN